jgi:hypothetical protein
MAIWNIRYYIDPETGLPHIYNHDVVEHEVEEVLARPGEDRQGEEGSRVAIGQTDAGRYLRVIVTTQAPCHPERSEGSHFADGDSSLRSE